MPVIRLGCFGILRMAFIKTGILTDCVVESMVVFVGLDIIGLTLEEPLG